MLHRLCLSLPLILMVLGPVLPLVDMWRTLAQGATQTVSLGKFSWLYYNGLLMTSSFSYNINFVGMILPRDELTVKLTAVARRCCRELQRFPSLASFTFLWARACKNLAWVCCCTCHLARHRCPFNCSIVEMVEHNPKEKTIHFGGIKGQAIRQHYMDMTYNITDKDRHFKILPLLPDIGACTPKYTFSHPNGLLFVTRFAQIALVISEGCFQGHPGEGLCSKGPHSCWPCPW